MKDYEIWQMITKHLAKDETEQEKDIFFTWLHENTNNQHYFNKVKKVWDAESVEDEGITAPPELSFREKFTLPNIIDFITKQALGNIIGLSVGVWVASKFTHKVTEPKSLHNLFGLIHRKTTVVNEIPHWMQTVIAIMVGYIALELVHYFLQSKKIVWVWKELRKLFLKYSASNNFNR